MSRIIYTDPKTGKRYYITQPMLCPLSKGQEDLEQPAWRMPSGLAFKIAEMFEDSQNYTIEEEE